MLNPKSTKKLKVAAAEVVFLALYESQVVENRVQAQKWPENLSFWWRIEIFEAVFYSTQQFELQPLEQTADKYKEKQLRKEFQDMDRDGGGFVDISELSTYIIRPTVHNIQNRIFGETLTGFFNFKSSKRNLAHNDENLAAVIALLAWKSTFLRVQKCSFIVCLKNSLIRFMAKSLHIMIDNNFIVL